VACRFMQDRHTGPYVGSKRVMILVGKSPACPTIFACEAHLCNHWIETYCLVIFSHQQVVQPLFIVANALDKLLYFLENARRQVAILK
jgi:hypothetical protein